MPSEAIELNPTTPLEHVVATWYAEQCEDEYYSALADLAEHGCQSGMVSELIYYTDTAAFYAEHREAIDNMLQELCNDCGCTPAELLKGWDASDIFARETTNQNILAWFGFETTASNLTARAEG